MLKSKKYFENSFIKRILYNLKRKVKLFVWLWLILSNLCFSQEVKVATNTATIEGTSVVYGISLNKMDNFAFSLDGTETTIFGLEPGTVYFYKRNNKMGSFTTLGRPPIRFEWVVVSSITKTSAFVGWKTNLKTNWKLTTNRHELTTNGHDEFRYIKLI